jgi:hypothetical protein
VTTRSEKRVIPLELFFDLVFVFALTQVTALMSDDPTWQGLGRGMLVLAALWWAWGAYAWLTDEIDADEDLPRLAMFTSMTANAHRGARGARRVRRRRRDLRLQHVARSEPPQSPPVRRIDPRHRRQHHP